MSKDKEKKSPKEKKASNGKAEDKKEEKKKEEKKEEKKEKNGKTEVTEAEKEPAKIETETETAEKKKCKVTLTYFDGNGRAELARLIMAAGNMEFDDNRISGDQWSEMKPDTIFGQLPILEYEGRMLVQSMAIARFLAKKTGLYGKDEWEQAQADQIADYVADFNQKWMSVYRAQTYEEQMELLQYNFEVFLPKFLNNCAELLKKQGGKYFTGDNLSYGDIFLFQALDSFSDPEDPFFKTLPHAESRLTLLQDHYPTLVEHKQRVRENQGIKKWMENRPVGQF